MDEQPIKDSQANILRRIQAVVDAEREFESSKLLFPADKGDPKELSDLDRLVLSIGKAQTLTRLALELSGVSIEDRTASKLDHDLKVLRSELVTLSKGHASKILVASDTPSPRRSVIDNFLKYRLRLAGCVYMEALCELGDSKTEARNKIKSLTRSELTPDMLRYFPKRLTEAGLGDVISITYESWVLRYQKPELDDLGDPDVRAVAVKRAAEELKEALVAVAAQARTHSQL